MARLCQAPNGSILYAVNVKFVINLISCAFIQRCLSILWRGGGESGLKGFGSGLTICTL